MTSIRSLGAIALALFGGQAHANAQVVARDSGGVRIADVSLSRPGARLSLSANPTLDLGGDAPDVNYEFHTITALGRTRDGGLVVANNSTQQLRFFDVAGKFIRSAGRKGAGPGEFQVISRLFVLPGDSVLVNDDFARRIILFAPDGQAVRTLPVTAPQGRKIPRILGVLANGTLIGGSSDISTMAPRPEPYYFGQHLLAYSAELKFLRDIGSFDDSEHFVQRASPQMGGTAYWDLAFGRKMSVATSVDRILLGDGTTFELRYYASTGKLLEILRLKEALRPLTPAIIAAYRARETAGVRPAQNSMNELRLEEMPFPKTIPAFSRFFVAQDRRIWVQRYPMPEDVTERWIVLQPDGAFVGELELPRRFRLMGAGRGDVYGVWRDNDDVEHVRVFALISAPPASR